MTDPPEHPAPSLIKRRRFPLPVVGLVIVTPLIAILVIFLAVKLLGL